MFEASGTSIPDAGAKGSAGTHETADTGGTAASGLAVSGRWTAASGNGCAP